MDKKEKYDKKTLITAAAALLAFLALIAGAIAFMGSEERTGPLNQEETSSAPVTSVTAASQSVIQTSSSAPASSAVLTSASTSSSAQTAEQTTGSTAASTTETQKAVISLDDLKVAYDYFIGYDKTSGTVLYEKNADERCYPASVTKIVTAIVAIENLPIDALMTVGSEIRRVPANSSSAELKEGQVFTLSDMLYAMILPSGNDAANTIAVNTARYLYGNDLNYTEAVERFMALCNKKIKEIGAEKTHFSCPYGSYRKDHYTTARDMLKISVYAMENPVFAEVAGTLRKKATTLSGETCSWKNTNYLLDSKSKYYVESCTGVKNGMSSSAGYCLSASAVLDGREIYAVGFHAPSLADRYGDMKNFFEAAFAS